MLTMIMVFMSLLGVEVPDEEEKPEMPAKQSPTPDYSYVRIYSNMDNLHY